MSEADSRTTPSRRRQYQRLVGKGLNGVHAADERFYPPLLGQTDHGTTADSCKVEVIFKEIKTRLVEYISDQSARVGDGNLAVVGCVAWLTDSSILECLHEHQVQVSIIVNKEQKYHARELINKLTPFWLHEQRTRHPQLWHKVFETTPQNDAEVWTAVRCCGEMLPGRDSRGARSLMHDKFLVFIECEERPEGEVDGPGIVEVQRWTPFAVWSGSANLTSNSSRHFENAMLVTSDRIADAYWGEWGDIALLSEPLDFLTPQATPTRVLR